MGSGCWVRGVRRCRPSRCWLSALSGGSEPPRSLVLYSPGRLSGAVPEVQGPHSSGAGALGSEPDATWLLWDSHSMVKCPFMALPRKLDPAVNPRTAAAFFPEVSQLSLLLPLETPLRFSPT